MRPIFKIHRSKKSTYLGYNVKKILFLQKIVQKLKGQKSRKLTLNVMKYYTAHAVNVVKNYCNRNFTRWQAVWMTGS